MIIIQNRNLTHVRFVQVGASIIVVITDVGDYRLHDFIDKSNLE